MTYSVRSVRPQGPGSSRARSRILSVFTVAGMVLGSGWALEPWNRAACEPATDCLQRTIHEALLPTALRLSACALVGLVVGVLVWSLAVRLDRD